MKRHVFFVSFVAMVLCVVGYAAKQIAVITMGKQPDGAFVVSSEQRVEPGAIAFDGRPTDLALHPSGAFVAVLNQQNVFLADKTGVLPDSKVPLDDGAAYRGAAWSPDGTRLFVSVSEGYIQELTLEGKRLTVGRKIAVKPKDAKENPRPGGMAITRDGAHLFVVCADRNSVAEIDPSANKWVREYPVQNIPFEVRLTPDEKTLIVTNWGGRKAEKDDEQADSGNAVIVVDPRGTPASGTVSLIDRATAETKHVDVGLHPTAIAVQDNLAYVANAASDTISAIDVPNAKVVKTIPIKWGRLNIFGSMPCALAIRNNTLYVCNGGDNAVCEIALPDGAVQGFRPAGYYPVALAVTDDGATAYVVNTKGNGSVRRTSQGKTGNAHDFQGTLSILDLNADLSAATAKVADDDGWNRDRSALRPNLKVYNGAIKHVLYIIKENRTYDQFFGDIPQGNGDPKLCDLGEKITPNHHKIATEFTLFDNAYVAGTNSADGHAWSTQAVANDYLEHFYTGYRTYPDDGDCAMSLSSGGMLWDAALKKGKTFRDYGEFCDDRLARFEPEPKDWLDVWKDRVSGKNRIVTHVGTRVVGLRPYVHQHVVYWPLLQSDQARADIFIKEYGQLSSKDKVPNLMILTLPCDHTEGRDPKYPKPQSMVADNDLALGRVVEAVSHSRQWKDTCIFVIEDDAQSGTDHVDGHRTVFLTVSPYVRRKFVDRTMNNTVSMIRSIELMLGLDPMNKFDALTPPLAACFMDTPDLTPFDSTPNRIALDVMNPPVKAQKGKEFYWTKRSLALDWSGPDRPDADTLNRVIWHTLHGVDTPYPTR